MDSSAVEGITATASVDMSRRMKKDSDEACSNLSRDRDKKRRSTTVTTPAFLRMHTIVRSLPLAKNAVHSPILLLITLGAHAQREYCSWVCLSVRVSVCYSQYHFLGVCSSHKGYDLLNGQ